MVAGEHQSVAAIEAQLREVAEKKAASLSALRTLAAQVLVALTFQSLREGLQML